jgi:hypothetical protein
VNRVHYLASDNNKGISLRSHGKTLSRHYLSISRYKKIEYEEVQYEKPEVIIQKIETLENEIQKSLKDLKALLK